MANKTIINLPRISRIFHPVASGLYETGKKQSLFKAQEVRILKIS